MKNLLIITFSLFFLPSQGQDLIGVWKGSYVYARSTKKIPISLKIELNSDSSLAIHSYTLLNDYYSGDTIMICAMTVLKKSANFLLLKETDSAHPGKTGLQTFRLKYKKEEEKEYLTGTWTSKEDNKMTGSGEISLVKLIEN